MAKEVLSYEDLDKIIDSHKNNRPQKKALLILKSDVEPYRGKDIPKRVAEAIITNRKSTTKKLAMIFEDEGNDDLALSFLEKADNLDNVIHICYADEDD